MRATRAAPPPASAAQTFDLALRTQRQSDERYDPILLQYVMRIEPVWSTEPARGSTIEVRASLTLASGSTLEAVGSIEW
ncbi:MAG: hypothetical protein NTU45_16080 [Planctomycetota bacterium]|nr:hypothetical protein [Planctomycetota bacterium]